MKLSLVVTLMTILYCAVPAVAQTQLKGQSVQEDNNNWANTKLGLGGTVRLADGSTANGAVVQWVVVTGNTGDLSRVPGVVIASRKTGADGKFNFKDAPSLSKRGPMRLIANAGGRLISVLETVLLPGADIVMQEKQSSNLEVILIDPSGKPVINTAIGLALVVAGNRISWIYGLPTAKTDANGVLRVNGLPGPSRLRVTIIGKPYDILPGINEIIILRRAITKPVAIRAVLKK